jgi:hypothetical protein
VKLRGYFIIACSGILIMTAFTNCEQGVDFNTQLKPVLNTPSDVKAYCDRGTHETVTLEVNFPKPNQTCAWNQNGNLPPRNDYFQARIEQRVTLDLPAEATICDMAFDFPTQKYLYDDHFLMTLNGKVLASSYNFADELSATNGLLNYAWSPIAGIFWDQRNKEGIFCAKVTGTDGNAYSGSCSWPDTDIAGQISMSFPAQVFYATMANDLQRTHHEISFVSIGDNDDLDCEHSDINFNVTVKYVR